MTPREEADTIARQPWFWPDPKVCNNPTPMARAIQYPLADPHWQARVLNAYTQRRALSERSSK